jgi:ATP-dependent Clp protease ATP-binding subunit ClpA
LVRENAGVAGKILQRAHITHARARKEVEARRTVREEVSTTVDMPLSFKVKAVLEHAGEEADQLQSESIDSGHLLVGLLRQPQGLAAEILASMGVRLDAVREEVRHQGAIVGGVARPERAFDRLAAFLKDLGDREVGFQESSLRADAVRVEIIVPEERWVVVFFADGRVNAETFAPAGGDQGEAALRALLDRLDSRKR